jgi:hypothetical protein
LEWLPTGDAESEAIDELVAAIAAIETSNPWLETRRAKLLFRIGQHCERQQNWPAALAVYERCAWPGARHRRLRVLERSELFDEAFALASQAAAEPESEEEAQRIERMLPRLQRKRGERVARVAAARPVERSTLVLPRPEAPHPVEYVARDHLTCDSAPVHYVENALINSLFGLLCWEPVFAALPGAFFHPFQRGRPICMRRIFMRAALGSSPRVSSNSIAVFIARRSCGICMARQGCNRRSCSGGWLRRSWLHWRSTVCRPRI